MADRPLIAKATTTIEAPPADVWDALVTPSTIKKYMFGTNVVSEWKKGSPIVWKGEWEGRKYEDKGVILEMQPLRLLRYTHYSPLTGLPDTAENYHSVSIELSQNGDKTAVSLSQDNNATEEARHNSEKNWNMMLDGLKKLLEG